MTARGEQDALTAEEMFHAVRDTTDRLARLETSSGRIKMTAPLWGVIVTVLATMCAAVAFMARVDARQEEQGALLRATVQQLHDHVASDQQGVLGARVEMLQGELESRSGR